MVNHDIRWQQRFDNFSKSCDLLSEISNYEFESTIPIIREGFVQRFEIAFDLAWKTLKDYMEYLGHELQPSPRPVIKEAFAIGLIKDGQIFIDMLDARNLISHNYNEETFNKIFLQIKCEFEPALQKLCELFKEKLT
ncbi:MAG: nucleotidyltransferase substrate binding protein [Oscillospiraceae bacterium]|jgi:nucleotidyltransferase substrate binding protein (TIGR01987 family)|nr:nucleotidyltransferase substrate binding protein [Oscillospiraceae bacterium]